MDCQEGARKRTLSLVALAADAFHFVWKKMSSDLLLAANIVSTPIPPMWMWLCTTLASHHRRRARPRAPLPHETFVSYQYVPNTTV
jgi:hypothetical protein